jgi:hypothetical protein
MQLFYLEWYHHSVYYRPEHLYNCIQWCWCIDAGEAYAYQEVDTGLELTKFPACVCVEGYVWPRCGKVSTLH